LALDPEYLLVHYAALSTGALREIDRNDLVPEAQALYDAERATRPQLEPPAATVTKIVDDPAQPPDWLPDAVDVFSSVVRPGLTIAPDFVEARDVLIAAEIPAWIAITEIFDESDEESDETPHPDPANQPMDGQSRSPAT
jgi:hypothetical protein